MQKSSLSVIFSKLVPFIAALESTIKLIKRMSLLDLQHGRPVTYDATARKVCYRDYMYEITPSSLLRVKTPRFDPARLAHM